jgi:YD repeat-containing protein
LRCDISGTIQTPVYDSEGRLIKIEHTSDGSVVRTDAFTYSGNVITETRTLSNGKTLAYIYYLETNIVEVD